MLLLLLLLTKDALRHFLEPRDRRITAICAQNSSERLLGIFGHHINLNVHRVSLPLLCQNNSLLGVSNQHDLPPPLRVVHLCDSQARAINSDETLEDDVPQHIPVLWLESKGQGISIRCHGQNLSRCIDVALDKVAAHAGVGPDGTLQVDSAILDECTEVGYAQRLRGDADFEGVAGEGRHGEAAPIYGDGVTVVAVFEEE